MKVIPPFLVVVLILFALLISTGRVAAQSNLVVNGDFESQSFSGPPSWYVNFNGADVIHDSRCPQGNAWLSFESFAQQELETIPGRSYYLKFACNAPGLVVRFGNMVVDTFTNIGGTNFYFNNPWTYNYCHLSSPSNRTWLHLESTNGRCGIDDLSLVWRDEPVAITAQPAGATFVVGGGGGLECRGSGGPPLNYQWRKNGVSLPGSTNRIFILNHVVAGDAGIYSVAVSNHINGLISGPAPVDVDSTPRVPQIVLQPESRALNAGVAYNLRMAAVGNGPLFYQWKFNGTNLPDATNSALLLNPVQLEHAGTYVGRVENSLGVSVSLPATISVATTNSVSYLNVGNFISAPPRYLNPTYDVDGTTRLPGPFFTMQIYAGATPETMTAVGSSAAYRGSNPNVYGFFSMQLIYIPFPEVQPTSNVLVQVRAWESAYGSSYEEARASGGRYGASPLVATNSVSPPNIPSIGVIPSFNLHAGLPSFTTGRISRGAKLPDGNWQWILTGAPGFTYLVEKRTPPQQWSPLVILTNGAGTATFIDPNAHNASINFYRSRMLD
ncbi:MAG: hypothetical protein QOF48_2824 [Verrucomicrobiota bacterium]|jgi:hypothetical protein